MRFVFDTFFRSSSFSSSLPVYEGTYSSGSTSASSLFASPADLARSDGRSLPTAIATTEQNLVVSPDRSKNPNAFDELPSSSENEGKYLSEESEHRVMEAL